MTDFFHNYCQISSSDLLTILADLYFKVHLGQIDDNYPTHNPYHPARILAFSI